MIGEDAPIDKAAFGIDQSFDIHPTLLTDAYGISGRHSFRLVQSSMCAPRES
jgi:hypothetical protein